MQTLTEQEKLDLQDQAIAADRLRTDPAFQRAILAMRKEAIEALVSVDPTNIDTIRTEQSRIRAIDALCGELATTILRGTFRTPAAVA